MRLKPRNWEKFQHYKHRNPPWIRFHRELLDNKDFQRLHVASRALAPMLWLLASEYDDASIDASLDDLSFRLRTSEEDIAFALIPLIEKEFFIVLDDDDSSVLAMLNDVASGVLAECKHFDASETEAEESRVETEKRRVVAKTRHIRKKLIPDDFSISDRVSEWAKEKGHSNLQVHFEYFVSTAKAKGYTYVDWDEAFMTAIRNNWAKVDLTKPSQIAASGNGDYEKLANGNYKAVSPEKMPASFVLLRQGKPFFCDNEQNGKPPLEMEMSAAAFGRAKQAQARIFEAQNA